MLEVHTVPATVQTRSDCSTRLAVTTSPSVSTVYTLTPPNQIDPEDLWQRLQIHGTLMTLGLVLLVLP